jgi:phosphatidate cytidylyltransferase
MRKRVGTAFLLLAVFTAALFLLPEPYWAGVTLAFAAAGAWEWARLARLAAPKLYVAIFVALGAILLVSGARAAPGTLSIAVYTLAALFWTLVAPLWLGAKWRPANPLILVLTGWVVILPSWLAIVELRALGPGLLLWGMGIIWVADSAAYLSGLRFGRRKLAPQLSPGKTWEGVMGALAGVTLYAIAGAAAGIPGIMQVGDAVLLGTILPFVLLHWIVAWYSIVGDLFESWIKRVAGVKDSGALLPGHGGVLDRVDSLTSTLPLIAFFWAVRA